MSKVNVHEVTRLINAAVRVSNDGVIAQNRSAEPAFHLGEMLKSSPQFSRTCSKRRGFHLDTKTFKATQRDAGSDQKEEPDTGNMPLCNSETCTKVKYFNINQEDKYQATRYLKAEFTRKSKIHIFPHNFSAICQFRLFPAVETFAFSLIKWD